MNTPTRPQPTKFVFVTGGVVSSLGKGIAAASLGIMVVGLSLSDASGLTTIGATVTSLAGPASNTKRIPDWMR